MKKLLTIAMITLAAVAAKADLYLYWTVDVDLASESGINFAAAGLMESNGAAPLYSIADGVGSYQYVGGGDWVTKIAESGSYLIALFDADYNIVGLSETLTYSDLVAANHVIDYSSQNPASTTPWNGSSFTAIPEPTSGLMLLLGLVALALKRKRV